MKKISILFYLVLSFVTFTSCEQQDEISALDATESEISIDQKSQINLNATTFSKEEIENNLCGEKTTDCELWAGQHMDAGNISVGNDNEYLYVKVFSESGFQNKHENVKMWIGTDLPSKRPAAGKFPTETKATVTGNSHTFKILLSSLDSWEDGECEQSFYIILHADVMVDDNGVSKAETAFGGCESGAGNAWWYYMDYTTSCCEDNNDDDQSDGKDDESDDDATLTDDCYSSFAAGNNEYTDRSYCFTYTDTEDNTLSGWYNEFSFVEQQDNHYTHPLYAKVEQCNTDPATWVEIGYVDIYLFSEGLGDAIQLFTTVKYHITKEDYELTEANLYFNHNDDPNYINSFDGHYNYDQSSAYWVPETSSFEKIPWPGAYYLGWGNYFVPNAKICKTTASD
ncbi:MAG: hypothetical protein OEM04_00445 [Flavobacteriaceae bacterium]|nr:hypothetical protein [Flavobacteriaceae bacterium]